jgi:predicted nucleic acid-binding protein
MWAEKLLASGQLHAPELVLAEALNMLRRLERATPEAHGAQDDLVRLDIDLFSFDPFADRVWELRHNLPSYDAWYVALAEALGLPLATLDARLSRSNLIACRFLTPSS